MQLSNYFPKYILFLFFFFNFSKSVQGQNSTIDSLINQVNIRHKVDTIKINLLYKVAFSSFQSDLELTKSYLKQVENLSDSLNYIKGKAKASYLKGILESRKSNYDESLLFFKKSLSYYESINDKDGIAAVYVAFGITYFVQSKYDEALNYYKKASEINQSVDNKIEFSNNLVRVANVYNETGRYEEAISNYKKALEQFALIKDEDGINLAYSNLGVLYKTQGNYQVAIEYYNKGLAYSKKKRDTLGMAIKLNNLGDAYKSMEKYETALYYLKQSLSYAVQKKNKDQIAVTNSNIGNVFLQKKKYDDALKYYKASLKVSQEINNLTQVAICFYNIGELYLSQNNSSLARENFIKAKEVCEQISYQYVLSASLLGIAETYLIENKHEKALFYTENGKKIAQKLDLLENNKKAEELLSRIYANTGNYKKALHSHRQFKTLNDSLFNKESIEKITALEYEYKYKQKLDSASIRELKLTRTVKTTTQNLEKSQRNLLLGVIAFLMTTIVLGGIIFYLKLRNQKSQVQNIVIEQKLLRSQMTPHFIFNSLSVLQGMILDKEEKKSVSYLSKFSKLMRLILENSREKTVLLSEELKAIEHYLALQNLENESYQYAIHISDTVDPERIEIPPMLVQPFVENAIEHAFEHRQGKRNIELELYYKNEDLNCQIKDNGIGIDAKVPSKSQYKTSLSTTITAERLQMLSKDFKKKGSILIEDRKKYNKKGTIVTLILPYKTTSK